ADSDAVVAGCRLNPYVFVSGLARDPPVGDAVQGHAARHAEILGAGRLAQPYRAFQQHRLGVVLDPPREVLPMRHGWVRFPGLELNGPRLIEIRTPLGKFQLSVLHLEQRLDRAGTAIGREPHDLAALVPVGEHIARDAAINRPETWHVEELVAQKSADRFQPYLLQDLEPGALEAVITL